MNMLAWQGLGFVFLASPLVRHAGPDQVCAAARWLLGNTRGRYRPILTSRASRSVSLLCRQTFSKCLPGEGSGNSCVPEHGKGSKR